MKPWGRSVVLGVVPLMVMATLGCEKQAREGEPAKARAGEAEAAEPKSASRSGDARPKAAQPTKPLVQPPEAAPAGEAGPEATPAGNGEVLVLTGLTMKIPEGWVREPVKPGPMAAKAAFQLPTEGGDAIGCAVRITHFPGMKGMDDLNVNRWLAQVRQPDGSPSTPDNAKVTVTGLGLVRLTVVDVTGTVNLSQTGSGTGAPDHRLIAAVVDHPLGPHFVKVSGGAEAMARWEQAVHAFLTSAKVE